MVNYPIGDLIAERVRAMGVHTFYKHFTHNGVTGPNMATVYSDRGQGVRAPHHDRITDADVLALEVVHVVPSRGGIEEVRGHHRVEAHPAEAYPVVAQDNHVELYVLPYLGDLFVLEQRLKGLQGLPRVKVLPC
jgi:hypothetical protein